MHGRSLDLVAADLNHDGKEDIIVGGSCVFDEKGSRQKQYKRFIKVLLSNRKGDFQQSFVYISEVPDLDAFAPSLWTGNLDTDGNVDLVFTEPFKTQRPEEIFVDSRSFELIKMLKGKGDGTFLESPVLLAGTWPGAFLDVRGNTSTKLTIICLLSGGNGIEIGQGIPPSLGGGTLLEDVIDAVITDVNNDGWAEIVAAVQDWRRKATKIVILERKVQ